jgi:hypothetical protein
MMRFDISMCIAIKDNKLLLHLSGRPTNAQWYFISVHLLVCHMRVNIS